MVRIHKKQTMKISVQDNTAATTSDRKQMSDIINITWHGKNGAKSIPFHMPGAGDPDDRYRGGMITKIIK